MRALICILLLSFAAVASAQVPRGPVIAEFGACALRQSANLARRLMQTELDSRDEQRLARQLFEGNDSCTHGRLVLSSFTGEVRGTIAEALIESEPTLVARLSAAAVRPAQRAEVARGRAFVANYARCLAEADPAKSVALLATERQSQAEFDAVMAFGDTLNDCMPMGAAYRIDQADVRNHIASHLYRTAMAQGAR